MHGLKTYELTYKLELSKGLLLLLIFFFLLILLRCIGTIKQSLTMEPKQPIG